MADVIPANSSEQELINPYHLAVGFMVLVAAAYLSALAAQLLLMR